MCFVIFLAAILGLSSCQGALEDFFDSSEEQDVELIYTPRASSKQDRRVRVQHILIAFRDSIPKEVNRSKSQAKELAFELKEKVKENPGSLTSLVEKYSDASIPGIYEIANFGVTPSGNETKRGDWHDGFGAAAFALKEGQVYVLEYDETRSPFGYHVMMRLPY